MLGYSTSSRKDARSGRDRLKDTLAALQQRFGGYIEFNIVLVHTYHSDEWTDEYAGKVATALDYLRTGAWEHGYTSGEKMRADLAMQMIEAHDPLEGPHFRQHSRQAAYSLIEYKKLLDTPESEGWAPDKLHLWNNFRHGWLNYATEHISLWSTADRDKVNAELGKLLDQLSSTTGGRERSIYHEISLHYTNGAELLHSPLQAAIRDAESRIGNSAWFEELVARRAVRDSHWNLPLRALSRYHRGPSSRTAASLSHRQQRNYRMRACGVPAE